MLLIMNTPYPLSKGPNCSFTYLLQLFLCDYSVDFIWGLHGAFFKVIALLWSPYKHGRILFFCFQDDTDALSWPGPRTVVVRRTDHGFGFTLRHFIVYPPDTSAQIQVRRNRRGYTMSRWKWQSLIELFKLDMLWLVVVCYISGHRETICLCELRC